MKLKRKSKLFTKKKKRKSLLILLHYENALLGPQNYYAYCAVSSVSKSRRFGARRVISRFWLLGDEGMCFYFLIFKLIFGGLFFFFFG